MVVMIRWCTIFGGVSIATLDLSLFKAFEFVNGFHEKGELQVLRPITLPQYCS